MELDPCLIPHPWTQLANLSPGDVFEQQNGDPRLWMVTGSSPGSGLLSCVALDSGALVSCGAGVMVRKRDVRVVCGA